jgi:hypothetical protein
LLDRPINGRWNAQRSFQRLSVAIATRRCLSAADWNAQRSAWQLSEGKSANRSAPTAGKNARRSTSRWNRTTTGR